jgi:cephalosporin-C deacetylase-like acetyl esterase
MKQSLLSRRPVVLPVFVGIVAVSLNAFADVSVRITPDAASGVYASGEIASWTINVNPGPASPAPELSYRITKDGSAPVASGKLDFSGAPVKLSATRSDPGTLVAQIYSAGNSKALAVGGAIFDPEKIAPSAPEPVDFDTFWRAKLKELAAVPINAVLEKKPGAKQTPGVDFYHVTLDNIRGTKVRGQLARPSAEGKYPALLVLQYAGVYPLKQENVINDAKAGWLVLNISAHDQPIAEPKAFYDALSAGVLKDYTKIGNEDRETSYFLRMFLGSVRAADYLASRPDWNGKILIATGTSQGGLQAFVAAALSPSVTGVMALVPAGCDVHAPLAKRANAWPYWLSTTGNRDRDMKKIEVTAGYFDGIHFASRIHSPALIAYGLADETARPAGIAAAVNALKGPKEALILARSTHKDEDGSHDPYKRRAADWKKAALAGESLPPEAR